MPALITQPGQSRAGMEAFHSLSTHVREHYRTSCERKCKGLSHFYHYHHTTSRKGVCAQFCHVTEISCIRGALLGSFGSSLDSAAHLANFFMSVSPEVPIDEMASALFKALGGKKVHSMRWTLPQSSLHQDRKTPGAHCLIIRREIV